MKNKSFPARFRFAWAGIGEAWRAEKSFRTQVVMAAGALGIFGALGPKPIWWAVLFLILGAVLAAELFNTALERVVDCLHPEQHPMLRVAKDCGAGAVLVLSASALLILVALLFHHFSRA